MLKLDMENFRRFVAPTTVTFEPGLTILSGLNGAGKSTTIEALLYALFGARRGQEQDVRSDVALGAPSVSCELQIDGRRVCVSRSGNRVELEVDGVTLVKARAGSKSEAQKRLTELLGGLDRDHFEHTYVALQGDTAGLVTEDSKKRREIIEQLLQLEVLKQAVELQSERQNGLLGDVKGAAATVLETLDLDASARALWDRYLRAQGRRKEYAQQFLGALNRVVEQYKAAVDAASQALGIAADDLEQRRAEHSLCKQLCDLADKALQEHRKLHGLYIQFNQQISKREGQITQIEELLQQLDRDIVAAEACAEAADRHKQAAHDKQRYEQRRTHLKVIRELHDNLTQVRGERNELVKELEATADVATKLEMAEQSTEEARKAYEGLQAVDPTLEEEHQLLRDEESLKAETEYLREALHTLQSSPDDVRCPTCDQPFAAHQREDRSRHLADWFESVLPLKEADLQRRRKTLGENKRVWKRQCEAAAMEWKRRQKDVLNPLQAQLQRRNNLTTQLERVEQRLRTAQQKWDTLGESDPYDPNEEPQITSQLRALEKVIRETEQDALRFNSRAQLQMQQTAQRAQLVKVRSELDDLIRQRDGLGYDGTAHQNAENAFREASANVTGAYGKYERARAEHERRKTEETQQQQAFADAERRVNVLATTMVAFEREERLLALLTDFQRHFFVINTAQVARRASELVQHSITDQSVLGIEFVNDDLKYRDASNILQPIDRLSGGEKALVGLCLRIALAERAQAITNAGKMRLLILDEVLSSLDEERRDAVQRTFADVLRRGVFEHIIMITHIDAVKQGWQAAGMEVRKTGSKTSEVVRLNINRSGIDSAEAIEVE